MENWNWSLIIAALAIATVATAGATGVGIGAALASGFTGAALVSATGASVTAVAYVVQYLRARQLLGLLGFWQEV